MGIVLHFQMRRMAPMISSRELPTRWRLSIIAAASVILTMATAIIAFNSFELWQLRRESQASLTEAIYWENGDAPLATRAVEFLPLEMNGQLVQENPSESLRNGEDRMSTFDEYGYTEMEQDLATWYANNPTLDSSRMIQLAHGTCYAEMVHPEPGDDVLVVAYVDVTAQIQLLHMVNLAFVAISILGCMIATWLGWRAGKSVEEANEAQKRFYENMSHELKTPVAAIRGYAEGALLGVVEPRRANESIVRESERMTRQIEQILDLSRLEAGAIVPEKEHVEMAEFLQDCLMPFEGIVRTRNLDVRLELAEGSVWADPDLLEHAVENVISNAVRHASTFVAIRYDGATLCVENDGSIPNPEELDHIFDRFHTGTEGGSGVGLALTHEIMMLHGWRIVAERTEQTLLITIAFERDAQRDSHTARAAHPSVP